ncbi:MAG TPA: hypothetical protein VNJ01_14815 [Bacteriovoracaceae bacterium]|nr:hypothetical protein [Bacteriovoracaceae bacterium]
MRVFFFLLLLSCNAFSSEWADLVENDEYKIVQKISLPVLGSNATIVELTPGDKFKLREIYALSMGVVAYSFVAKKCPGRSVRTEMEIIPVQQTNPVIEIGVQLEKECELNIFIEGQDTWTPSIFEE